MIKINVLGSCCSRDLITEHDTQHGIYDVPRCVTIMSPMSQYMVKDKVQIEPENFSGFRNEPGLKYLSKISALDINSGVIGYIGEEKSDYLLLDIVDIRLPLAKFRLNSCITYTNFVIGNREEFERNFGRLSIQDISGFTDNDFVECISWYYQEVLKIYRPEQIILNDLLMVDTFFNAQLHLQNFDSGLLRLNYRTNTILRKLYVMTDEVMKGCMHIPFPDHVYAIWNHQWGLYPLHYAREWYEYAQNALGILTNDQMTVNERQQEVNRLCVSCSQKFLELRKATYDVYISGGNLSIYEIASDLKEKFQRRNVSEIHCVADPASWESFVRAESIILFPLDIYDQTAGVAYFQTGEDLLRHLNYTLNIRFRILSETGLTFFYLYDPVTGTKHKIGKHINEVIAVNKWVNLSLDFRSPLSGPACLAICSNEISGNNASFEISLIEFQERNVAL